MKRFGRNQKRRLRSQIAELTGRVCKYRRLYEHSQQFPTLQNESMILTIRPDLIERCPNAMPHENSVLEVAIDPRPGIFSRRLTLDGLQRAKRLPNRLAGEISRMFEHSLEKAIPVLLKNIPD